jgi:HSP20 family molecular chaperone IbpA
MPANSFFEKLKRGMGIEIPTEEKMEEKEKPRKTRVLPTGRQVKKIEIKEPSEKPTAIEPLAEKKTTEEVEEKSKVKEKEIVKEEAKTKEPSGIKTTEFKEAWLEPVGQLAVDVYQTETELVIQSAIAGVKSEDLDISLEGDVITIAGERKRPFEEKGDYFSQECYWGKFSRQIILPVEVDPNRIEANLKDGILTIKTAKLQKEKKRRIIVRG